MEHAIKYFGLNNVALENDLRRVAREKKVQLRPSRKKSSRDAYYPQITQKIRHDATVMSQHYELFYCLEISIRDLIRARLEEKEPTEWWNHAARGARQRREKQIAGDTNRRDTPLG